MGLSAQNEPFLRCHDVSYRDRPTAFTSESAAEAGLIAERIHEPRLTLCLSPNAFQGLQFERLARFR